MQVTDRGEPDLEWLRVVRMADLDAIRWAIGDMRATRSGQVVERATMDESHAPGRPVEPARPGVLTGR